MELREALNSDSRPKGKNMHSFIRIGKGNEVVGPMK
jgi:hypothetical protein